MWSYESYLHRKEDEIMSWYKGMKDVQLKGFQTIKVSLSSDLLQKTGADYPFYIDFRALLDAAFGDTFKDVIGAGNYEILNYQFWDFMFESFVWPNWWTDHEYALYDIQSDVNFLIDVAVLSVKVVNDYTGRESVRDNVIFAFTHPDFSDERKKLSIYLGGFFSPAQELIMSNFNEIAKDSLFHECIHALKRSGDDLLKDIMYGNSDSEVTEEIMTHLVTDRFGSLNKLHSLITKDVAITYDTKDGIINPVGISTTNAAKSLLGPSRQLLHAVGTKQGFQTTQARIKLSNNLDLSKKLRRELKDVVKGKKDSHKDLVRQTLSKAGLLQKDSLIKANKIIVSDKHN